MILVAIILLAQPIVASLILDRKRKIQEFS